jgi:hypothetical protein
MRVKFSVSATEVFKEVDAYSSPQRSCLNRPHFWPSADIPTVPTNVRCWRV